MRATFAQLVDRGFMPWDIERLTDRQIVELCFHPRTEKGEIEPIPDPPKATKEVKKDPLKSELFEIDILIANRILGKEDGERTKEKVRAKYAALAAAAQAAKSGE